MKKILHHLRAEWYKYLLETLVITIGILGAYLLNSWSEGQKVIDLEKHYLNELIVDLQADSMALGNFKRRSDLQNAHKRKLIQYINDKTLPEDSAIAYFKSQFLIGYNFNPATATIDEMKSTGGIAIIQNKALRQKIIQTYNAYNVFMDDNIELYKNLLSRTNEKLYSKVPNLFGNPVGGKININAAVENFEIQNHLFGNHVYGMNQALSDIIKVNEECLKAVRAESRRLQQ